MCSEHEIRLCTNGIVAVAIVADIWYAIEFCVCVCVCVTEHTQNLCIYKTTKFRGSFVFWRGHVRATISLSFSLCARFIYYILIESHDPNEWKECSRMSLLVFFSKKKIKWQWLYYLNGICLWAFVNFCLWAFDVEHLSLSLLPLFHAFQKKKHNNSIDECVCIAMIFVLIVWLMTRWRHLTVSVCVSGSKLWLSILLFFQQILYSY